MQYELESSFLDFAVEHILWHEVGVNESLIKIALVQCHLDLLCRSDIVLVDFNPNITWRVLLHPDFLNPAAKFSANVFHLFLDINKEGGVFSQVNSLRIEHIVKQNTVGRLSLCELCESTHWIIGEIRALNCLATVLCSGDH